MEFVMLALGSFWLGALHALEPGHGKTVVGAYLIGSKGRTVDAVILGLVVTLTHTGIVILLGVLSTVAAAFFVPQTVGQVLEVVSGALIVAVGAWMIAVRLRQARGEGFHHHPHSHAHDHPHNHSHEHDPVPDGDCDCSQAPAVGPSHRPTLGQLVGLGVSGGIVPCPAALTVLLAAVAYGHFVRGLSLVVIFSLGMATVLVAIGILMVKAADFASRYVAESKWTRIAPVVSAVLITAIGVGLTARAVVHVLWG